MVIKIDMAYYVHSKVLNFDNKKESVFATRTKIAH